jgi:hypothetical protein
VLLRSLTFQACRGDATAASKTRRQDLLAPVTPNALARERLQDLAEWITYFSCFPL